MDGMVGRMAKRGFFAELNHQRQLAEKRQRQEAAAAFRAQAAADRDAERASRDAVRARAAADRAGAKEKAAADKLATQLEHEANQAEVDAKNADLAGVYAEIDGILAWTLDVDDYVDLASLRADVVEHPPFDPGDGLRDSAEPLEALVYPPEPTYVEPPAPTGMFANKKKHEAAVAQARAAHDEAYRQWHAHATELHAWYVAEQARREQAEQIRQQQVAQLKATYDQECAQRDADAQSRNDELARLINDLAFDVESAIQEYVGIVLSNSVYPESFPVTTEHTFDLASRELTLAVTIPDPSQVPEVKEYKYIKGKKEISSTTLPAREQKDRYANAVWQVAVRTLHEVFEADRAGKIHSIALTVGCERISPATGRQELVPLVVAAADRETFLTFDLSQVVPHATLTHLGAALSKSPFDLTPADTGRGVRVRGQ